MSPFAVVRSNFFRSKVWPLWVGASVPTRRRLRPMKWLDAFADLFWVVPVLSMPLVGGGRCCRWARILLLSFGLHERWPDLVVACRVFLSCVDCLSCVAVKGCARWGWCLERFSLGIIVLQGLNFWWFLGNLTGVSSINYHIKFLTNENLLISVACN